MKKDELYMPLTYVPWESLLAFNVIVNVDERDRKDLGVGFMPIFKTKKALREVYSNVEILTILPKPEPRHKKPILEKCKHKLSKKRRVGHG